MRTHHCEPTLGDREVLDFCKRGYLILPGIVPPETNERVTAWCAGNPSFEPSDLLGEEWFHQEVLLRPPVAGAVRSLLGNGFGLPLLISNHRVALPAPAQQWHRDGGSRYGPELRYLQVFYYPQETSEEAGPTELLPGSHFIHSHAPWMAHYDAIRGAVLTAAPAGSVFLTVYSIWHRRAASSPAATGTRNLLKFNYWRLSPPTRDWRRDPGFSVETADYSAVGFPTFREQFRDCYDAAEMFCWLCGLGHRYRRIGGQGWPMPAATYDWYGTPERPGYPLRPGSGAG